VILETLLPCTPKPAIRPFWQMTPPQSIGTHPDDGASTIEPMTAEVTATVAVTAAFVASK